MSAPDTTIFDPRRWIPPTSTETDQKFDISRMATNGTLGTAGTAVVLAGAFAWTTRTFAAGNFTASGAMTWTVASGDVKNDEYCILGKLLFLNVSLDTTTVGGVVDTALRIALPASAVAAKQQRFACVINDSATGFNLGLCSIGAAGTLISVFKPLIAAWTLAVDTTYVDVSVCLEIQ